MRKRCKAAIGIGFLLIIVLCTVYFAINQADYDKRTIQPYEYQDLTTGTMFFEKGTYTFTFEYTYAPDTQVQIIRGLTADADNRLPMVLASAALCEDGQTVLTVALDETVYDLQLRYTGETERGFTNIESVGPVWHDTAFVLGLIALIAAAMALMYRREQKHTAPVPNDTGYSEATVHLLLLAAAVGITLPILRDFLVSGHDLSFHLMRIEAIKDGLLDRQFPVRIGTTFWGGLGYGSPVLYPELFLYLPAVFRLCGVSLMATYQAFIFLINLAALLITYHAVKRLTGKATVGLITSLVYALGVNRMITLYTRAAIGEALALLFFPCVMLGMAEVLHRGKLSKWLIVGMTGLIQTHVVSVEIAAIACAAYTVIAVVLRKTTGKNLLRLLAAAGITVLINLWFLVPFARFAPEDLRMFNYTKRTMCYAVYPAQWFASFVNPFGKARYLGTTAEMPLSVGTLLGVGILLYILFHPRDDRTLRSVGHVSLGFGLAALVISSTLFPWTYVAKIPVLGDLMYAVQFPWRYLGIAGFFLSLVFAVAAYSAGGTHSRLLIAACVVLAVFNIAPFMDQYIQSDDVTYTMQAKYDMDTVTDDTIWDYCYADTDFDALENLPMRITAPDGVAITGFSKHGTHITFTYAADTAQTVTLPLYLYPGYRALLDGTQELTPTDGDNHLLTLALPAGEGTVTVWYAGFWYWNAANFVSLFTMLALAVWAGVRRRKKIA